jgi:hypothetical protein
MKLPQTITLAGCNGSDDIELYLAAMSSHDGTAACGSSSPQVRIVCANTQRLALRSGRATYAIRHTRTARAKIAQARQALGIVWRYAEEFETAAQHRIDQTQRPGRVPAAFVDQLWPPTPPTSPAPAPPGIRDRRNTTLRGLFTDADTQHADPRDPAGPGCRPSPSTSITTPPPSPTDVRAARVLTSHALGERKQRAYDLLAAH